MANTDLHFHTLVFVSLIDLWEIEKIFLDAISVAICTVKNISLDLDIRSMLPVYTLLLNHVEHRLTERIGSAISSKPSEIKRLAEFVELDWGISFFLSVRKLHPVSKIHSTASDS